MTNMASRRQAPGGSINTGGSATLARHGCPNSGLTTTRPAFTRLHWGASSRPIQSDRRIRSTSLLMSQTIRRTTPIHKVKTATRKGHLARLIMPEIDEQKVSNIMRQPQQRLTRLGSSVDRIKQKG